MLFKGSRYLQSGLYLRDGRIPVLKSRRRFSFNTKRATSYTYQAGDRLDILAHKVYGDPLLYWAILDANPQYRHELEIKAGDTILIPDYKEVLSIRG